MDSCHPRRLHLGAYDFTAGAYVSLSDVTRAGNGNDIAWDTMAFAPASGGTWHTSCVAMGDSYSSGEGNSPYYSDRDGPEQSR